MNSYELIYVSGILKVSHILPNACGICEETQCYHIMSIALFGRY